MPARSPQPQGIFDTIARDCIATQARELSRVVTRIYDKALRPVGVRATQLGVLVAAGKMGVARPAMVCRVLKMDASTLSRNVERLLANGWLEVVDDPDARTQPFRLTASGRRLVEKALPAWRRAQNEITALLGEQGVRALAAACAETNTKE
jgi:DNA-binding MarR family transcriptional regulator